MAIEAIPPEPPTDSLPFDEVCSLDNVSACCAVADTLFNAGKTVCKAMEAGMAGAVVVATPHLYGQIIAHDETGLLAETAEEWERALMRLVRKRQLRRRLAGNMRRCVEGRYDLAGNAEREVKTWGE